MKKTNLSRHLGLALLVGGSAVGILQAEPVESLFKLNCASCHGEDGRGDTAVGKALKARNMVTDEFKQGDSVEAIAKTLETGIPGTGMASFSYLKAEDRLSLAQYIHGLRQGKSTPTEVPAAPVEKVETPAPAPAPVAVAPVEKVETPAAQPQVEVKSEKAAPVALAKTAPTQSDAAGEDPKITRGRQLYKLQGCNSCHGDDGQANTPTGMALKARSFVKGDYKYGGDIAGISKVLKEGIAGSAMVAYPQIQGDDLTSLATFLIALKDNPGIAVDPEPSVAAGSGKISINYAMELMAEYEKHPLRVKFDKSSRGAEIFASNCADCHGENGQGGVSIRMISSAPYYRVKTMPILGHDGDWMKRANFDKIITEGLPGRMMPGNGTMTKADLDALYDFFVESQKAAK